MDTIDCPKCGCEHEPAGNHEDDAGEMTCDSCGFAFIVEIEYDPSYDTHCVDHEYGEWDTSRVKYSFDFRRCQYCGKCEIREATDAT